MTPIESILAPGRALESLARRAGRGHRPAWQLLLRHLPLVVGAENRWLFPALLHGHAGGARRALLLPFGGEHEQMLDLLEHLARVPVPHRDPMFVAAQSLMLRHARTERRFVEAALAGAARPDASRLARFVERCRPLLDDYARLAGTPTLALALAVD
jgi:hypothetical protein